MNAQRHLLCTALIAALATLSACGGGGSSPTDPAPVPTPTPPAPVPAPTVTLSGTAAAGLPLVGSVTVKDAKGQSKTVPIVDGNYTVDVTGMTAPYVLRATGMVGEREYILHSAATSADANGNVNITPLTDLVLANVAGQITSAYFDAGKFEGVTQAELNSEAAQLKARLLPLLLAVGVDASIDLLRSKFTPLTSAFDKVLDLINISVDPSTQVASITNLVTQQRIDDDLRSKAAAEASAPKLDQVASLNEASTDLPLVRAALEGFIAKFATGLPAPAELKTLLSGGFLHHDSTADQFAKELASDSSLIGGSAKNIVVQRIDYSDPAKITAYVSFSLFNKDGQVIHRDRNFKLRKGTDGVWRLHGDQRVLSIDGHVHMVSSGGCKLTGLEFWIEDRNSSNNGGEIAALLVQGPGLPAAGLRYVRNSQGDHWLIEGNSYGSPFYIMGNSCAPQNQALPDSAIAAIPDAAAYEIKAFTSAGVQLPLGQNGSYKEVLPRRPLTVAELAAAAFPVITSPTALDGYVSGSLSISASNLNAAHRAWVYLGQTSSLSGTRSAESDVSPSKEGKLSVELSLSALPAGETVLRNEIRVESDDSFGRNLMTVLEYRKN